MADYIEKIAQAKLEKTHSASTVGDEWRTPELEFLGIQECFGPMNGFSIDLFTDGVINSKCKNFFTAKSNALTQNWYEHCLEQGIAPFGFANPPFSKKYKGLLADGTSCTGLHEIMEKSHLEMKKGFHSVFFVPLNFEAGWFPHHKSEFPASEIYKLTDGRVTFDVPDWYVQDHEGVKPSASPGGMCVIVFNPYHKQVQIDDIISRDYLRELGQQILDDQNEVAA
jgi:phage N-6-adenine-methyltransferase